MNSAGWVKACRPTRTLGDGGASSRPGADNGDWHVSYVNGWTESLQYLVVTGGVLTKPGTPEIVDNGFMLNGTPNADGQHIVGDDSSISVDA